LPKGHAVVNPLSVFVLVGVLGSAVRRGALAVQVESVPVVNDETAVSFQGIASLERLLCCSLSVVSGDLSSNAELESPNSDLVGGAMMSTLADEIR